MTAERVAGIGRVDHQSVVPDDLHGVAYQPQLRIVGMDLEKLAHDGLGFGRPVISLIVWR